MISLPPLQPRANRQQPEPPGNLLVAMPETPGRKIRIYGSGGPTLMR
jgi:hypothetical protein